MNRALILLAFIASPALAERSFTIAGEAFAEDEIVDARAQPDTAGQAAVMVTFSESAGKRLAALTKRLILEPAPVVLDGKILTEPMVREEITGSVIQITGDFTLAEAEALALKISGKEPLRESLEDSP